MRFVAIAIAAMVVVDCAAPSDDAAPRGHAEQPTVLSSPPVTATARLATSPSRSSPPVTPTAAATVDSSAPDGILTGRIELIGVELDERAIVVRPEAPDNCWTQYQHVATTAEQTATAINVKVSFTHDPRGACYESAPNFDPIRIQLESPLKGRPIVDVSRPDRRLDPELASGSVYGDYQITADADAIRGATAEDMGTVLLWHGTESPTRQATWVPLGGLPKSPALAVPIPACGGEAWFGLERQLPTDSGIEQRYPADLDTDVAVPIPSAPGERILDRHLTVHLAAGAISIDDDQLRLDAQAITISWA